MQTASATTCPDCGEPTPTGGWIDGQGRTHHVGCGDPFSTKAMADRIAELEAAIAKALHHADGNGMKDWPVFVELCKVITPTA